jgi:hypothetical protein
MIKKYLLAAISILCLITTAQSQGYYFGLKGGLTISTQKWGQSYSRSPLMRYHAIAFIESLPENNQFSLFAQLGYHVKGSQIRTNATTIFVGTTPRNIPARKIPFLFNNLSLTLGAKQKFDVGSNDSRMYYLIGVRGDYTLSTQLRPEGINEDDYCYLVLYPLDRYVKDFTFGMTAGGGFEFPFSEYVGGLIEFTVNPDFTLQYDAPAIPTDLCNINSGTSSIRESQIRTITFEVTFGIRFLHKIEYIDTKLF